MRSLLERDEDQLHHPSAGVLLARYGRHLLALQQVGEQSLRHRVIQDLAVHSKQLLQHLRTLQEPAEVLKNHRQPRLDRRKERVQREPG